MKKRILTTLCLALVASVGFAACGCGSQNSGTTETEHIKVVYIVYPWGDVVERRVNADTGLILISWDDKIPSKEGYTFVGYFNAAEGGTEYLDLSDVPAGGTAYARHTPNPNCVIKLFDADDDISQAEPIATVTENLYDAELRPLPVPTDMPENAAFDGWYADKEFEVKMTDGTGALLPDRKILKSENGYVYSNTARAYVLYAKYTYPTYTVTFHFGDEHGVEPVEREYKHNESLIIPDVRDGEYSVKEWTTDRSGYDVYDVSDPVTGDLDLYAVWRRHRYVGLWSGGEKVKELSLFEDDSIGLDDFGLTYSGKIFDGWYTDPNFDPSTQVYIAVYSDYGALYAKWVDA